MPFCDKTIQNLGKTEDFLFLFQQYYQNMKQQYQQILFSLIVLNKDFSTLPAVKE
jgi:hypothetical protein